MIYLLDEKCRTALARVIICECVVHYFCAVGLQAVGSIFVEQVLVERIVCLRVIKVLEGSALGWNDFVQIALFTRTEI